MSGPTLPIESIAQILHEVFLSNTRDVDPDSPSSLPPYSTLAACRLVSRSFAAVATPLLYRRLSLTLETFCREVGPVPALSSPSMTLQLSLLDYPERAALVQGVIIDYSNIDVDPRLPARMVLAFVGGFVCLCSNVKSIVKCFTLDLIERWQMWNPSVQRYTLTESRDSNYLLGLRDTSLSLLFSPFTSLQSLRFDPGNSLLLTSDDTPFSSTLQHLTLFGPDSTYILLQMSTPHPALTTLSVDLLPATFVTGGTLLLIGALHFLPNLQNLYVKLPTHSLLDTMVSGLRDVHLAHLRTLSIRSLNRHWTLKESGVDLRTLPLSLLSLDLEGISTHPDSLVEFLETARFDRCHVAWADEAWEEDEVARVERAYQEREERKKLRG